MYRRITGWSAIAGVCLIEARRRKDVYVALLLSLAIIAAAATMGAVGAQGMDLLLKDAMLTVVSGLSGALTILFAARRVPEDADNRTIYPLLARPVSRADYLIGQFLGTWAVGVIALLLLMLIGIGALSYVHPSLGFAAAAQFLLLRVVSLAVLAALTLLLSLGMPATAASTVAISLSLLVGALPSAALLFPHGASRQIAVSVATASYYTLPHVELFDLTQRTSAGLPLLDTATLARLAFYAAVLLYALGGTAMLRFERKAL